MTVTHFKISQLFRELSCEYPDQTFIQFILDIKINMALRQVIALHTKNESFLKII